MYIDPCTDFLQCNVCTSRQMYLFLVGSTSEYLASERKKLQGNEKDGGISSPADRNRFSSCGNCHEQSLVHSTHFGSREVDSLVSM